MKHNYILNIIYFTIISFGLWSCGTPITQNEESFDEGDGLIQITQEQFDYSKMEIGEFSLQIFEETVNCNAYIMAPSNGEAMVSSQISGIVEKINFSTGEYVKKGQILCTLSSNEFIELQNDYLRTSVLLNKLKSDYQRSKSLSDENIGAKKNLIAVESEYNVMKASYQSLKLRLELLGLDVSKIENGELYSAFPIVAPINGYITRRNLILGEFTSPDKEFFEIVDIDKLQLQLSVFDSDIHKVKKGQNVLFKTLESSSEINSAVLTSVGKSIDRDSKTILCIAEIIKDKQTDFINRSYVDAKIIINQWEAISIPNEAIVKSEKDYFVFVLENKEDQYYQLKKIKVEIGNVNGNYTEIISPNSLTKIVTRGVYNLQ